MNRARARRRWMQWQRYVRSAEQVGGVAGTTGYVTWHWRVAFAGRTIPGSLRRPWMLRSRGGGRRG